MKIVGVRWCQLHDRHASSGDSGKFEVDMSEARAAQRAEGGVRGGDRDVKCHCERRY